MASSFMSQTEIAKMFAALDDEEEKPVISSVKFQPLEPVISGQPVASGLDKLADVQLTLGVELGSTRLTVKEILDLEKGSVIELDKLAGEPVEVNLNNIPFARGEVVVINEVFGVRITGLLNEKESGEKRE
jgi:flagellar motor switch protein FliN/FliY